MKDADQFLDGQDQPTAEQTAWVFAHIDDLIREGGSFRYLIYTRMKFKPSNYSHLYAAGGQNITNALNMVSEVEDRLKGLCTEHGTQVFTCPRCMEEELFTPPVSCSDNCSLVQKVKNNFNINNEVKVKLTSYGLSILEDRHNELFKNKLIFTPPAIDEQGWSKFQMWELMRFFGDCISLGMREVPFETTIQLECSNIYPEGETPSDVKLLKDANLKLAIENQKLKELLQDSCDKLYTYSKDNEHAIINEFHRKIEEYEKTLESIVRVPRQRHTTGHRSECAWCNGSAILAEKALEKGETNDKNN